MLKPPFPLGSWGGVAFLVFWGRPAPAAPKERKPSRSAIIQSQRLSLALSFRGANRRLRSAELDATVRSCTSARDRPR